MKDIRLVFEVARWEFDRFFKIKDVILTLLILVFIAAVIYAGVWVALSGVNDKPKIAVINAALLQLDPAETTEFDFRLAQADEEGALRQSVGRQDIDGLLIIKSIDSAELVTYQDQPWTTQLESFLTNARNRARLTELNLGSKELSTVTTPFNVAPSYHRPRDRAVGRIEMGYAGALVALMILAVFACYQYQFTSITGEKHQRVTEQIISAISPQVWMDGKILGISAVGLALIIVYGTVSLLMSGIVFWMAGYNPLRLFAFVNVPLTLLQLVLALLGILFWNCFFAAIAATVDDPNTSSRSVIMFLPFLPVMITIAGIRTPDSALMKVLGIFPVTSPTALSARLVLTSVAAWEVLVAVALLLGTIWLFRKAAARIFRLAMLMHGKEPSLREMARWLYEA
jgi:ABC-2 type transport system permease protein